MASFHSPCHQLSMQNLWITTLFTLQTALGVFLPISQIRKLRHTGVNKPKDTQLIKDGTGIVNLRISEIWTQRSRPIPFSNNACILHACHLFNLHTVPGKH
jgi:hypothetical protein